MAQLTLQVDSPSLLEQLKNVLSLIQTPLSQGVLPWKMSQTQKHWQQ